MEKGGERIRRKWQEKNGGGMRKQGTRKDEGNSVQ
jgi:hypothetical protein